MLFARKLIATCFVRLFGNRSVTCRSASEPGTT